VNRFWVIVPLVVLSFFALGADDCTSDHESSSDRAQRKATNNLTAQAQQQVGMPGVTNFTERRIVSQLYTLRDQNITTHAYVMDWQGRLWFLCDSLGYGLPYGVQFTNPHRLIDPSYHNSAQIDQAEPNGLFMPPSAEGTWVICAAKKTGEFQAVYVEPRVIVSPFRLHATGSWQEESPSGVKVN
jgi:hypothetical protein